MASSQFHNYSQLTAHNSTYLHDSMHLISSEFSTLEIRSIEIPSRSELLLKTQHVNESVSDVEHLKCIHHFASISPSQINGERQISKT